ncbi:MAG: hypothetical protein E6H52_13180 [Betaproteobacteria bacterium]|nr:MAG: hypothetical protein E6H52_13180 [Betaproteobacteria bacterium]
MAVVFLALHVTSGTSPSPQPRLPASSRNETRAKRIAQFVQMLARHQKLHP